VASFIIAEISAVASQTPDRFTAQGDAYLPEVLVELILYASAPRMALAGSLAYWESYWHSIKACER
jgi:hypothetical protein